MKKTEKHNRIRKKSLAALLAVVLALTALFGSACGSPGGSSSGGRETGEQTIPEESEVPMSPYHLEPKTSGYQPPEFLDAVFNAQKAEGTDEFAIDLSSIADGYVAVHTHCDARVKFQVTKDELTFTYDVVNDKDQIFPLPYGDGEYAFRALKNISDSKYAVLYTCEAQVKLTNEFSPFLRPSQYADYTEESDCVKMAKEFAEDAATREDFIAQVYLYVTENITYDHEKAATVKAPYFPEPDAIMEEKKGICFDYASLAASMLRSQGIPTKIIFGYVAPDDLYHAWNMFYTEEGGWVLVELAVNEEWNRIDLTFAASHDDVSYVGDGTNYVDAYAF